MGNINQLPIGYVIGGHYEVLKVLGQGGFGIVYLVKDQHKLDELLVVKELFAKEFSFRKRESTMVINQSNMVHIFQKIKEDIKKEVTILSKISNPNIVKAYGYLEENETIYSVMEYLKGMDLERYLKEHGSFSEEEAKDLLKQLIHGLKPIHKKNIIHRDIKPNNIIRTPEGVYKIIDFSSNKQYVDGKTTTITSYQNPIYTAPELTQKKTVIGEFSDIYAMGMTLVRTLCSEEKMPNITDRFIDDSDFREAIDSLWIQNNFSKILHKMIELNYKDRFQTLEEIEAVLEGNKQTVSTLPPLKKEEEEPNKKPKKKPKESIKTDRKKKPLGFFSILLITGILSVVAYSIFPAIENYLLPKWNALSKKEWQIATKEEAKPSTSMADRVTLTEHQPTPPLSTTKKRITTPPKQEIDKNPFETNNTLLKEPKIKTEEPEIIKPQEPTPQAPKICTNANVKAFLDEFNAISKSDDLAHILSFYSPKLKRYFNLRNITHKELAKDKRRYLKRWKQRNYKLINFKIEKNYVKNGTEYCKITKTTKWAVSSEKTKKSGQSTVSMLLEANPEGELKVKSIYTLKNRIDAQPKNTPEVQTNITRSQVAPQEELMIYGDQLLLMVNYPKQVKANERVLVKLTLINRGVPSDITGGISSSFIGFKRLKIKKISNSFSSFRRYDNRNKIFHRITHQKFTPQNLLLEFTKKQWRTNEEHSVTFEIIPPKGVHQIQLLVRGALNSNRLVPTQGTNDQQAYPAKLLTINIE